MSEAAGLTPSAGFIFGRVGGRQHEALKCASTTPMSALSSG
jgi:hypothetical protein